MDPKKLVSYLTIFFWCSFNIFLLVFLTITNASASNEFFHIKQYNSLFGLLEKGGLELSKENVFSTINGDVEQWIKQPLDHFDSTNRVTWKQRYFINFEYFGKTSDAPVFLWLGGETYVTPGYLHVGQMFDNGRHYKAAMVMLEHRFYGESHPTSDTSTTNLRYLHSRQALADAARFVKFIKHKHGLANSNKWVVFGGSYPGSLAAWLRLKYPNLISGAVASSAPVLAKFNFNSYLKVVTTQLGPKCVSQIHSAMSQFTHLLGTSNGRHELTKKFNLCTPLEKANSKDISMLVSSFSYIFDTIVQSKNNSAHNQVWEVCSKMTDERKLPLDRLSNVVHLSGEHCRIYNYKSSVSFWKYHLNYDLNYSKSRLWMYQSCTEFRYFQTSDYSGQPFGNYFSSDFFVQQCKDVVDLAFDHQTIQKAVNATNAFYGGTSLTNLSNVVFVNGLVDPWHELSVLKANPNNPTVIPLVIPETSHVRDMWVNDVNDPPSLKDVRTKIRKTIGLFLHC